jgi:hypothetical protein
VLLNTATLHWRSPTLDADGEAGLPRPLLGESGRTHEISKMISKMFVQNTQPKHRAEH